jgi:hypothetical protein
VHFPKFLSAPIASLNFHTSALNINIPNSAYHATPFPYGMEIHTSLTNTSLAPIVREPADRKYLASLQPTTKLIKRRTDCWGYQLSPTAIDICTGILVDLASKPGGITVPSDPGRTHYIYVHQDFNMVYYCINDGGKTGNIDGTDVNCALKQMDAKCTWYEASWLGSPESFEIIGKSSQSDDVCREGMGGRPF